MTDKIGINVVQIGFEADTQLIVRALQYIDFALKTKKLLNIFGARLHCGCSVMFMHNFAFGGFNLELLRI